MPLSKIYRFLFLWRCNYWRWALLSYRFYWSYSFIEFGFLVFFFLLLLNFRLILDHNIFLSIFINFLNFILICLFIVGFILFFAFRLNL